MHITDAVRKPWNERDRNAGSAIVKATRVARLFQPYLGALGLALAALLLTVPIRLFFDVPSLSRVFLVAVLISAISYGIWPGIFAALISVLFYDFFFLPPIYSLEITSAADIVNLVFFLVTAIIVGVLAARVRRYAVLADKRALTAEQLAAYSRVIGAALTVEEVLIRARDQISAALAAPVLVLLAEQDRLLTDTVRTGGAPIPGELLGLLANRWATSAADDDEVDSIRIDGWHFHALRCHKATFCLIGIRLAWANHSLGLERRHLLMAFAQQTASAIGQNILRRHLNDARVQSESEAFGATLLNSISHDFRGPLTAILGATTTLEHEWNRLRDDARMDLIITAREATQDLTAYVTNLLDISRLESGDIGPKQEAVMLSDLVGAALYKARAALADHRLFIKVPAELPLLEADSALLQQALVNILDNAAKYSPKGSQISMIAEAQADTVQLRILDEGPGVAETDLDRLFDKFFRAAATRGQQPGTGLGLTICRGIIEAMRGSIEAFNRCDRSGMCIRLTLPVSLAPHLSVVET
jgi:two-component system sensor histidine kinase KdpD